MSEFRHQPVLLREVVQALNIRPAGTYIDATYGRGGHARAILDNLGPKGSLWVFDRDLDAVVQAKNEFAGEPRVRVTQSRFSRMPACLQTQHIENSVDGILFDLGVSSPQLDEADRGFSFNKSGPLDMRMDRSSPQSAADWLKHAKKDEIVTVIRDYGEERFAKRIANAIVRQRMTEPIETTLELASLIAKVVPNREPGKHPATRSFQAIRIHINKEIEEIRVVLPQALELLAEGGGRLVVISFHSLEDREVKRFMRIAAKGDPFPPKLPIQAEQLKPSLKIIGKPVYPSEGEVMANPRARSAILRVAERVRRDNA